MDVARAFVYGLLGADYDSSPYTQTGRARRAPGGVGHPPGDRRVPRRRDQDPQGRLARPRCGSTTATPSSPTQPSSGCGNSSTALGARASCMAAGWLSSPLSSTPHGWSFPPASGHTRPAGARTRTTPPRRCASSPGRISRRRWPSSSARSSGRTVTMRPPSAVRSKRPRVSAPPPAPIGRAGRRRRSSRRGRRDRSRRGHGRRGGPRRRSGRVGGTDDRVGRPGTVARAAGPPPCSTGCCGSRHRLAGPQSALHEPGFVC